MSKKIKTQPWTTGPIIKQGPKSPATPSAYFPIPAEYCGGIYELSGDGYDPQPKSLGRIHFDEDGGAFHYYSKRTKDVTPKIATKPHKIVKGKPRLDMHAYDKAWKDSRVGYTKPEPATYLGITIYEGPKTGRSIFEDEIGALRLETIEQSYAWKDADGEQQYSPQWRPRYTKEEKEWISHRRYDIEEDEASIGDYGYVEEDY
jgi:hypothetical protein